MIVVDASAALAALLNDGQARQLIAAERLHVPHLVDSEIASGLRRLAQRIGWARPTDGGPSKRGAASR